LLQGAGHLGVAEQVTATLIMTTTTTLTLTLSLALTLLQRLVGRVQDLLGNQDAQLITVRCNLGVPPDAYPPGERLYIDPSRTIPLAQLEAQEAARTAAGGGGGGMGGRGGVLATKSATAKAGKTRGRTKPGTRLAFEGGVRRGAGCPETALRPQRQRSNYSRITRSGRNCRGGESVRPR